MTFRFPMKAVLPVALSVTLGACGPLSPPEVARFQEPALTVVKGSDPENPDACYGEDVVPAMIETVTEQVLERPATRAEDGTVVRPALYRTETVARILRQRQDIRFEAVCPDDMTPQFIASLHRALAVRGHYTAPVSGEINRDTRSAIRRFQKAEGLDSAVLSVAAAKRLGLAVYERHEALAPSR